MLRGAKNTVQGAKMAFGTPFLATPFGVALRKRDLHPRNISHGGLVNFHLSHARNLFAAISL